MSTMSRLFPAPSGHFPEKAFLFSPTSLSLVRPLRQSGALRGLCFGGLTMIVPSRFLLLSLLAFVLAAPLFAQDDLAALQGTWKISQFDSKDHKPTDEQRAAMTVIIHGDELIMDDGKRKETNTFKLDPSTKPKSMTLFEKDGKVGAEFIYSIEKDRARFCWAKSGGAKPTDFTAVGNDGLMVLERPNASASSSSPSSIPAISDRGDGDARLLQGKWRVLSADALSNSPPPEKSKAMSFQFKGKTMLLDDGKRIQSFTFEVDSSKSPKQIEIIKSEKEASHSIYALDGKVLKLCLTSKPGASRPATLTPSVDVLLVTMEKLPDLAAAQEKKDLEALQGTWSAVSAEGTSRTASPEEIKAMQLKIEGETIVLSSKHGDEPGTIRVDPTTSPKAMDFLPPAGKNSGGAALFIYEISGDKLRLCWRKPGAARPTSFTTEDTDGLMVFEKAK